MFVKNEKDAQNFKLLVKNLPNIKKIVMTNSEMSGEVQVQSDSPKSSKDDSTPIE